MRLVFFIRFVDTEYCHLYPLKIMEKENNNNKKEQNEEKIEPKIPQ